MNIAHTASEMTAKKIDKKILEDLAKMINRPVSILKKHLGISEIQYSSLGDIILQYQIAKASRDAAPEEKKKDEIGKEIDDILKTWDKVSSEEIDATNTVEEIEKIIRNASPNTLALAHIKRDTILLGKLKSDSSFEELMCIYNSGQQGGVAQFEAFKAVDELMLSKMEAATNREEAKTLFYSTFKGSRSQGATLAKWLGFCTNLNELREVFDASIGTPAEPEILDKLNEMAREDMRKGANIYDIRKVFDLLPEQSIGEIKTAILLMHEFLIKVREKDNNGRP